MKRTPLARRAPLARTSSLAPGRVPPLERRPARDGRTRPRAERIAGRKPAGNPIPPEARAAVRERSGGRCELLAAADCTALAAEQHHRQRRRDGGHGLANLVDACSPCHAHAHAHPALARDRGWIVSAFAVDPALEPVRYGDPIDRVVWFHDDGTTTSTDPSTEETR